MRQTLFRIPIDVGIPLGSWELPLFGGGILLVLWILYGAVRLWQFRKELTLEKFSFPILIWIAVVFVIVQAPNWATRSLHEKVAQTTEAMESAMSGPQTAELLIARGDAYLSLREYEAARKDYADAIESDPNLADGYQRLGWVLATAPDADVRDGENALLAAAKAIGIARVQTATMYDTVAAAYAEQGDFEMAVTSAKKAASIAFFSLDTRTGVGEVRERLQLYLSEQPYRMSRIAKTFPQSLPVYGYGFMLFIGFVLCIFLATRLASIVGIPREFIWDIGVFGLLAGIVGGRLFYIVQYSDRVFGGKTGTELLVAPFQLQEGGLVLLGGVIAGAGTMIWYCWKRKVSPLLLADVAVPAFFLALAFGRMGCLMNGCCYGDRCELPWAIQFPMGSVPDMALVHRGFLSPDSTTVLALQPSQVYSTINALILCGVSLIVFRYRTRNGLVLAVGMLLYPISRFLIEYLRGDEMGKFGTSLTISQIVSLAMFVSAVVYTVWLLTRSGKLTTSRIFATSSENVIKKPVAGASTQ